MCTVNQKQKLRSEIKKELLKNKEVLKPLDISISRNLSLLISELQNGGVGPILGGYMPIQEEPIWFKELTETQVEYSLVHMHDDIKLSYHSVDYLKLITGSFDLNLHSDVLKEIITPDLILFPGLAVTRSL